MHAKNKIDKCLRKLDSYTNIDEIECFRVHSAPEDYAVDGSRF